MMFYKRIKEIREQENLRQKDVYSKLKLQPTTYCRYEQGKTTIPLDFAVQLSKFYDVSIDYIAELTDDKNGLHPSSEDEQSILKGYVRLSERNKGKVEQLIADLLESQK